MPEAWKREEQPEAAVDRILDGADKAFVEFGVSAAGMSEIAEAAGCSRGTLYRYFKNRHELHLAYVKREGRAIGKRVEAKLEHIEDPSERIVQHILLSLREVRRSPGASAWFADGAAGIGTRMSMSGEVIAALTRDVARVGSPRGAGLRERWIVRVIVSLLTNPGKNAAEERALLERFVAPALMSERG